MTEDLPFDIVELVPCPMARPEWSPSAPRAPLREVAMTPNAWLPAEIDQLRRLFAADMAIADIAARLDRPLAGVGSKIHTLGLRRNSLRPWTELDDAELVRDYGMAATSSIAASLGRSPAAIHARAGLLGLTEGNPPVYSPWELAQLKAGYQQGVPVAQLAVLIGRPVSGLATVASRLGIRHANSHPDWTETEQLRALALAETGLRYGAVAARLHDEGFPRRLGRSVGQALRSLGYGRGWGRPWLAEEDDLIRHAYRSGDSLAPLRDRLGRSRSAIAARANELGLHGTHQRPNGWRTEPVWTDADIAILRRDYGRVNTRDLATRLGRKKGGVYQKAFNLGLEHGHIRAITDDEYRAIRIARECGLSLSDLSRALARDQAVVSKIAIRLGIPFATRTARAPRGRRAGRPVLSLADILAMAPGATASA
jgi:hypothetical protein